MGANSSSKRPVFDEKEDGEFGTSPLFRPSSPLYAVENPRNFLKIAVYFLSI